MLKSEGVCEKMCVEKCVVSVRVGSSNLYEKTLLCSRSRLLHNNLPKSRDNKVNNGNSHDNDAAAAATYVRRVGPL